MSDPYSAVLDALEAYTGVGGPNGAVVVMSPRRLEKMAADVRMTEEAFAEEGLYGCRIVTDEALGKDEYRVEPS